MVTSTTTRSKRVQAQHTLKSCYRVFRLILLTLIITYFLGCLVYFIADSENEFYVNGIYTANEAWGLEGENV